jgi:tetratricopeptide (TPR) repeat protein
VRQQTLAHAIDWSYQLLDPPRQRLLARLAVFHGGFDLEAMEATGREDGVPPAALVGDLEALVDSSLVWRAERSNGTLRFGMLESIREYALQRLHAAGEAETMHRRYAAYVLTLVDQVEQRWDRADEGLWLERLAAEHDNLRTVLRWAIEQQQTVYCYRVNGALLTYWMYLADLAEARYWLEATPALPRPTPTPRLLLDRAKVHVTLAYVLFAHGELGASQTHFEEATRLARAHGDGRSIAFALRGTAFVHMYGGALDRARDLLEQSLSLYQDGDDAWGVAWSLYDMGYLALVAGDVARAQPLLEEGLRRCREQGIMWGVYRACIAPGYAHLQRDDPIGAITYNREGLALSRGRQDRLGAPDGPAGSAPTRSRYAGTGYRYWAADGLEGIARVALAQGQAVRAVTLFAAAETIRATAGYFRSPVLQATHHHCLTRFRAQLAHSTWAEAWDYGTMGLPCRSTKPCATPWAIEQTKRKRSTATHPRMGVTPCRALLTVASVAKVGPERAFRWAVERSTPRTIATELGAPSECPRGYPRPARSVYPPPVASPSAGAPPEDDVRAPDRQYAHLDPGRQGRQVGQPRRPAAPEPL